MDELDFNGSVSKVISSAVDRSKELSK